MKLLNSATILVTVAMACSDPDATTCPDTPGTACIWAGTGEPGLNGDGLPLRESRMYWPIDVEFTADGSAYVLDWNNHLIRHVAPHGGGDETFRTVVGDFVGDGAPRMADANEPGAAGTEVSLNHPTDLQVMRDGTIYFAAWHNHKLRKLDPETGNVTIVAGSAPGFGGDGQLARAALFNQPKAIVLDGHDNLYVLDQRNQRVRMISAEGLVSTVVGTGMPGFEGDGGAPAGALLSFQTGPNPEPSGGLALDADGNLYIADGLNHCIRRVDFAHNTIERIAGTGESGSSGDGGPALEATLGEVRDLEFGPDGRLYFADTDHDVVRAVDLDDGTIHRIAGTGQPPRGRDADSEGDSALDTPLHHPLGIAFDPDGNLYIADSFNNRILKVWR
jgi:sugar lactone lactonase YvrE